jgi:orotidine-5'-phosphate decarboxylase
MVAYKSDIWKDKYKEENYKEATRAEAIRMRDELNNAISVE